MPVPEDNMSLHEVSNYNVIDENVVTAPRHECGKRKLDAAHHKLVLIGVYDGAVGIIYALNQAFVG